MDFTFDTLDTTTLADKGVELKLKNANGTALLNAKKEPVGFIVHGSDGEVYQKASRDLARKRVERAQTLTGKTVPDEQLDAANDDQLDLLVACISGWFGFLDGEAPAKFKAADVKAFLRRYPVAREQVDAAIMDRSLFIKASSEA